MLSVSVMACHAPYAILANRPPDIQVKPGMPVDLKFTGLYFAGYYDKGLFLNPDYYMGGLIFSATGLSDAGLVLLTTRQEIYYDNIGVWEFFLEIKGQIPSDAGGKVFPISIMGSLENCGPSTNGPQNFKIHVLS